ncbi:pilus assembly protein PilP [Pyxidicoccus sp. MSG2]|uniref:pilus assembly protein PilP n=1 Tax=Pyxidicoccus sp. MSG2 TaxID=2996790 RepID=UPI00226F3950|nr:pilus assembly protein PilP [Pyxidicoccus sp. MSG2]MCY1023290.1 pilus assembly protein PilP [Pyxidicoccus sp. MSG2]
MKKLLVFLAVVVVAVIAGRPFVSRYDELVRLREDTYREWAQIDVLLNRRYDLLPRLVATVKGYAGHEKSTLEEVAQAYSGYTRASTIPQKIQASYEAERQLRSLSLFGQLHPNLKADTHFTEMMRQLAETEDRLANQRMRYNTSVSALNKEVKSFYGRLMARLAKVEEGTYYEPPAETKMAPPVRFSPVATTTLSAGELLLKGTLASGKTRHAILQFPDGRELVVKQGMEVKEASARVKHIGDSEVTFQETVYDSSGQPQTREIRIRQ